MSKEAFDEVSGYKGGVEASEALRRLEAQTPKAARDAKSEVRPMSNTERSVQARWTRALGSRAPDLS